MGNLTVLFFDESNKRPIVHPQKMPDGKMVLDKTEDIAYIEILLKVDTILIGKVEYRVKSRQFFIDGSALFLFVEKSIEEETTIP